MKTLTTLTAIAALVAGMSIASAQTTSPPSSSQMSPPTGGKQAVTGNARFCLESTPGGALECKFASMAACEKEGKPNNRLCKPNPNIGGTTGSR